MIASPSAKTRPRKLPRVDGDNYRHLASLFVGWLRPVRVRDEVSGGIRRVAGRVWRRRLAATLLVVSEHEPMASGSRTTRAGPNRRGRMPTGPRHEQTPPEPSITKSWALTLVLT